MFRQQFEIKLDPRWLAHDQRVNRAIIARPRTLGANGTRDHIRPMPLLEAHIYGLRRPTAEMEYKSQILACWSGVWRRLAEQRPARYCYRNRRIPTRRPHRPIRL